MDKPWLDAERGEAMIELGKEYQLEKGWKFRLYAVDAKGLYSVHGAYFDPITEIWMVDHWSAHGQSRPFGHGFNLVEVRPRHKRTVWLNFYGDGRIGIAGGFYTSVERAANNRSEGCIACIKHTFDFAEGDGL